MGNADKLSSWCIARRCSCLRIFRAIRAFHLAAHLRCLDSLKRSSRDDSEAGQLRLRTSGVDDSGINLRVGSRRARRGFAVRIAPS